MKVLVLGGGGREHAIVHAFSKSEKVTALHCCPGNPGIAALAECHDGDPCRGEEMLSLCRKFDIDLVFVGPEAPLVAGTADVLRDAGMLVMGPGRSGARLEGSKVFSKRFMARHGIPTSAFECCANIEECKTALKRRTAPFVVKADGLAAGKGSFLPKTYDEAVKMCEMMINEQKLGDAGRLVVVEDYVEGQEISVLAFTDGKTVRILPSSQDHKRALDGDRGGNTGGMGAYSPVPLAGGNFLKKVTDEVLEPTIEGLRDENIPFCGVIYAGLMVKPDSSLSVLEYNVRMGDPETQVVLPVFEGDFAQAVYDCCTGRLSKTEWRKPKRSALGVVLASGGYPGKYATGKEITIKGRGGENTFIYHAGTKLGSNGELLTAGGRVLTVVGIASTLRKARDLAYERVRDVAFENMHYRNDIGSKSLKGETYNG